MKTKEPKLKKGDIVENQRNNFRRMIRSSEIENGKIRYSYYNEKLDEHYRATGEFDQFSIGWCGELYLLNWKTGRN